MMLAAPLAAQSSGEIYKVVDEDGNVTFTDQRPSAQAEPMDLPPLSVIESDIPVPAADGRKRRSKRTRSRRRTSRDLRRQFADFGSRSHSRRRHSGARPTRSSWPGVAAQPVPPELSARLYVDGEARRDVPASGSVSLTLDRGEHQVYRGIARRPQAPDHRNANRSPFSSSRHSVGFNPAAPSPRNQRPLRPGA